MNRKAVNILVFGIGVLMLLLRPYLIYQVTGYGNRDKNPVKSTLLQRMVKKKDDHHDYHENAALEVRGCKFNFQLPAKQISFFYFGSSLPSTCYGLSAFAAMFTSILLIRQRKHEHCLLSCFRI